MDVLIYQKHHRIINILQQEIRLAWSQKQTAKKKLIWKKFTNENTKTEYNHRIETQTTEPLEPWGKVVGCANEELWAFVP